MSSRNRILVGALLGVLALGAFWMLALAPERKEAARLRASVAEQRGRLATARQEIAAGRQARGSYAANYAAVTRLGKAVPVEDNVADLVYELDQAARRSSVDFRKVALKGTGAASAPTPTKGTGAGATPAAPVASTAATLPPGAAVGPAGLPTMPFTFSFDGDFFRLSSFFRRLERFIIDRRNGFDVTGRLLSVDGISLTEAKGGFPRVTASVNATAYLLPPGQGLLNGATPAAPTGTPVSSGSASGAGSPSTPTASATP